MHPFFKLLTTDPLRAFNYALNYLKNISFVATFLMEAAIRNVIDMHNVMSFLVRVLYFRLVKDDRNREYIRFKEYVDKDLGEIVRSLQSWQEIPSVDSEILGLFKKAVRNYKASKIVTPDFLNSYVKHHNLFKFTFD